MKSSNIRAKVVGSERLSLSEHAFDTGQVYGFDKFPSPNERAQLFQDVLNEQWPPSAVARNLKPTSPGIDVLVRIVWENDGPQELSARAIAWTQQHVKVYLSDPRLQVPYVWLRPADVRRAN